MKTPYGTLTRLIFILIAALLLFAPMRYGTEDVLYAQPLSVKMKQGDTWPIHYQLDSDDAAQSVYFESTDASVARVDGDGVIHARQPGKAQILLDAEKGARARVQVEVVGVKADTLALNTDALDLEKGQVSGLRAIFNDSADDTLVRWSSADERVALVDAVGRVSAVGGGRTQVTATAPNGLSASAEVTVRVTGDAMRITPDNVTVGKGGYLRLGARYLPPDTTDEVDHWSSNNDAVLRVQEDGTIFAAEEGVAVLSVFSKGGLSASTVVRVETSASDFTISPAAATLDRGSGLTLEPRFLNATGSEETSSADHYVTWTSSNPAVASVEDGRVTALASGDARISASADGKIASCVVKVQTPVEEVILNLDQIYVLREQTAIPIELETQILPEDADDRHITYTTDNDLVAIVNNRGLVTLVGGYGTATITARAESGAEDTFQVNVVATLPEGMSAPD